MYRDKLVVVKTKLSHIQLATWCAHEINWNEHQHLSTPAAILYRANSSLWSLVQLERVSVSDPLCPHMISGEFYAMITFCNPGVLGRIDEFNKRYANPILRGREPDSTDDVKALGQERSNELSMFVNQFIIRRTNSLLSAHLPPKVHISDSLLGGSIHGWKKTNQNFDKAIHLLLHQMYVDWNLVPNPRIPCGDPTNQGFLDHGWHQPQECLVTTVRCSWGVHAVES